MKVWTYILQTDKNKKTYVGITSHLQRRIKEHNAGRNRSTASLRPWKLIYRRSFREYASAREHEKFLKSGKGRTWIKEELLG